MLSIYQNEKQLLKSEVSIECFLLEDQIAIQIQKVIFRKGATAVIHRSASEKLWIESEERTLDDNFLCHSSSPRVLKNWGRGVTFS